MEWTGEVEDILEKLRINCVNLSEYHRKDIIILKRMVSGLDCR